MPPREYEFSKQLGMSHAASSSLSVKEILSANIPGAWAVRPATEMEDRHGTDWWVERSSGDPLSVDCKVRAEDWSEKGSDDLALEMWSVIERRKVGWTRDVNKRTDYILWYWRDTGRWCLIPFPLLCKVFIELWEVWRQQYKSSTQRTGNYHSECVFVPRKIVWAAIYRRFGGDGASAKEHAA